MGLPLESTEQLYMKGQGIEGIPLRCGTASTEYRTVIQERPGYSGTQFTCSQGITLRCGAGSTEYRTVIHKGQSTEGFPLRCGTASTEYRTVINEWPGHSVLV